MRSTIVTVLLAVFASEFVAAEGDADLLRSLIRQCTELSRCENDLDNFWNRRESLDPDTQMLLAETYLQLELPPKSNETPARKRALQLLSELALEYPENTDYPTYIAAIVFQVDPIGGLVLASEAVRKFPNDSGAHAVFAVLLNDNRLTEKATHHFERSFDLAAEAPLESWVTILTYADWAREAIARTRGPRAAAEFAERAKQKIGLEEWSSDVMTQAKIQRDKSGKLEPMLALDLINQFCDGTVVKLDEGRLCVDAIRWVDANLDSRGRDESRLAERVRLLVDYLRQSDHDSFEEALSAAEEFAARIAN